MLASIPRPSTAQPPGAAHTRSAAVGAGHAVPLQQLRPAHRHKSGLGLGALPPRRTPAELLPGRIRDQRRIYERPALEHYRQPPRRTGQHPAQHARVVDREVGHTDRRTTASLPPLATDSIEDICTAVPVLVRNPAATYFPPADTAAESLLAEPSTAPLSPARRRCLVLREGLRRGCAELRRRTQVDEAAGRFAVARREAVGRDDLRQLSAELGDAARLRKDKREGEKARWEAWMETQRGARDALESQQQCLRRALARAEAADFAELCGQHARWLSATTELRRLIHAHDRDAQERRDREAGEREQRMRRDRAEAEQRRRKHVGKEESVARRDIEHAEEAWSRALQRTLDGVLQRLELVQLQQKQKEAEKLRRQREHITQLRGQEADETEHRNTVETAELRAREQLERDGQDHHGQAQRRQQYREDQVRAMMALHAEQRERQEGAEDTCRVSLDGEWLKDLEAMFSDFFVRWNRLKVLLGRRQARVSAEEREREWMAAEDAASGSREEVLREQAAAEQRAEQERLEEEERQFREDWEEDLRAERQRVENEARREHGDPVSSGVAEEERQAWEAIVDAWYEVERVHFPGRAELRSQCEDEDNMRREVQQEEAAERQVLMDRAQELHHEVALACATKAEREAQFSETAWLLQPQPQPPVEVTGALGQWLLWADPSAPAEGLHDTAEELDSAVMLHRRPPPEVEDAQVAVRLPDPLEWVQGGGPVALFPSAGIGVGHQVVVQSATVSIINAMRGDERDTFGFDRAETRTHGSDVFAPDGAWLGKTTVNTAGTIECELRDTPQHRITAKKLSAVLSSFTFDNPSTVRLPGCRMLEVRVRITASFSGEDPVEGTLSRRLRLLTRPPLLRLRHNFACVPELGVVMPYGDDDELGRVGAGNQGIRLFKRIDFPDELELGPGYDISLLVSFEQPLTKYADGVNSGIRWDTLPGASERCAFVPEEEAISFRPVESLFATQPPANKSGRLSTTNLAGRRRSSAARKVNVRTALRGKKLTLRGRDEAAEVVVGSLMEPSKRLAVRFRSGVPGEVRELLAALVYKNEAEVKMINPIRVICVEARITNSTTQQVISTKAHAVVDLLNAMTGTFLGLATKRRVIRVPYGELAQSCLAWVPKPRMRLFPDAVVRSDALRGLYGGSLVLEIRGAMLGDKLGFEAEHQVGDVRFALIAGDEPPARVPTSPGSPASAGNSPNIPPRRSNLRPRSSVMRRVSFGAPLGGALIAKEEDELEEVTWQVVADRCIVATLTSPDLGVLRINFDNRGSTSFDILEQILRSIVFCPGRGRQWELAVGERTLGLTLDLGLGVESAPLVREVELCVTPPLMELPQDFASLAFNEGSPPLTLAAQFRCHDQKDFPKEDELSDGAFIDVRVVFGAEDEDHIVVKGDAADEIPGEDQPPVQKVFHHGKVAIGTYVLEPPGYEGRAPGLRFNFGVPEGAEGKTRAGVDPSDFDLETGLFRNVRRSRPCTSGGWLLRTEPHARQVLRNLQYYSASKDPQALRKVLLITLYDGRRGPSYACCEVEIQAINDATELHVSSTKLDYRQGSRAAQRGFPLLPHAKLVDPDTSDFRQGFCTIELASGGDGYDKLDFFSLEDQDKRYIASGKLTAQSARGGWLKSDTRPWHKYADPTMVALDRGRIDEPEAVRRLDEEILWLTHQGSRVYLNNVRVAQLMTRGSLGVKGTYPTGVQIDYDCDVPLSLRCAGYVLQCLSYECVARRVNPGVRSYVIRLNANDHDTAKGRVPDTRLRLQVRVTGPLLWAPDFSLAWRYQENDPPKQVNRHVRTNIRMEEAVTQGLLVCRIADCFDTGDEISLLEPQGLWWEKHQGCLYLHDGAKDKGASVQQRKQSLLQLQKPSVADSPTARAETASSPRRASDRPRETDSPIPSSPKRTKSAYKSGLAAAALSPENKQRRQSLASAAAQAAQSAEAGTISGPVPLAVIRAWERTRIELLFTKDCVATGRDIELLAKSFAFCNDGDNPSTDPRVVEILFSDTVEELDEEGGSLVATTVDIQATDDLTEMTLENSRLAYVLGQGEVLYLSRGCVVRDVDTPVFDGPDGYVRLFFHSASTKHDALSIQPEAGSMLKVQAVDEEGKYVEPEALEKLSSPKANVSRRGTKFGGSPKAEKPDIHHVLLWRGEQVGIVSSRPRDGGLGKQQFKVAFKQMPIECLQEVIRSFTYNNSQKKDHSLSRSLCIEIKDGRATRKVRAPVSIELHDAFIDLSACREMEVKRDTRTRAKGTVFMKQAKICLNTLSNVAVSVRGESFDEDGAKQLWPPDLRLCFDWGKGLSLRGQSDVTSQKNKVATFSETVLQPGGQSFYALDLVFDPACRASAEALQSLLRGTLLMGSFLPDTWRIVVTVTITAEGLEHPLVAKDTSTVEVV